MMTGRVLALVALIAGFAGAAPPAGAADTGQSPSASLSGFVCHTAASPLNRFIEVTATMRPIPSTGRMKLRFELQQRLPGRPFRQVYGGDLGRWRRLSAENWVVKKPVANLPAPAIYRFRVSFVWIAPGGSVIGSQTLLGPACRQSV
jgi:hypothetical protein